MRVCVCLCALSFLDNGSIDFDIFFSMEAANFLQMVMFEIFEILLFTAFIVKMVNFQGVFQKTVDSLFLDNGLMDFDNFF